MKFNRTEQGIELELSRRNLKTLLAKLDGRPKYSACTICLTSGQGEEVFTVSVRAVEDAEHYAERSPGDVHTETAAAL